MKKSVPLSSALSNFSTSCGSIYSLTDPEKSLGEEEVSQELEILHVEPLETM